MSLVSIETGIPGTEQAEKPAYRYNLTDETLDELEAAVVTFARQCTGADEGVVGVVVGGEEPLANFGRTYEQRTFQAKENYDFAVGMAAYEPYSSFLYTVDLTGNDGGAIAHTKRIVRALPDAAIEASGLTGIEVIDDRLTAAQPSERATLETIRAAHGIASFAGCLNIATNETTNRVAPTLERPHVMFSYKAVFEITQAQGIEHVFAYLNPLAVRSLGRLGLHYELLGGYKYHLPTIEGGYNPAYTAVCIPNTEHNRAAFRTETPGRPLANVVARQAVPVYYHP